MNGATPGGPSVVITSNVTGQRQALATVPRRAKTFWTPAQGSSAAGTASTERRTIDRDHRQPHERRGPAPGGEEPANQGEGVVEGVGAEEDPAETDDVEGGEALPGDGAATIELGSMPCVT